ncbi:MAG: histidinol phosphate phosphatase [candidate division Zixibacteria bacterium]|nr:histidinol phosphate phosphatase [candidate division Zixibacteria bacterium]
MKNALELAEKAVLKAGKAALRYFRQGVSAQRKSDGTPVTKADKETEVILIETLQKGMPGCGFLGEEFGEQGPKERRWIIDPIDGTRNFIRGIPIWALLIALEEEREIIAGVVHSPATDEIWTAAKGSGAFHNGRPISVSNIRSLEEATLLHSGLRKNKEGLHWDGLLRLVEKTPYQRGPGDYLGYILVAQGQGEIYLEDGLKPWDIAANKIIVEEAGGKLTDLEGRSTIYSGSALTTNGKLHRQVLGILHGRS